MPRKPDTRTPEQLAAIEAARAGGRRSASRPRDAKGRLLPRSSVDATSASPDAPADGSNPNPNTDISKALTKPTAAKPKALDPKTGKPKRARTKSAASNKRRKARMKARAIMGGGNSIYTPDIADKVLDLIACGSTLKGAARALGIAWQTVWTWRTRYPDFGERYKNACIQRAHADNEELFEIADNADNDLIRMKGSRGNEIVVQNTVGVQRDRLRIQVLQYRMGKALPEVYGDIKTIRDERHPLDGMTEEQKMAATLELIAKVKARLDQARALGLLPPKVEATDADYEEVGDDGDR